MNGEQRDTVFTTIYRLCALGLLLFTVWIAQQVWAGQQKAWEEQRAFNADFLRSINTLSQQVSDVRTELKWRFDGKGNP